MISKYYQEVFCFHPLFKIPSSRRYPLVNFLNMLRLSASQVVVLFVPEHCRALLGLRYWDESLPTPEPTQGFSLLTESLMRACFSSCLLKRQ